MNKIFFISIMVIAFFAGIIGIVNIGIVTDNRGLTEMVLANVEALASNENGEDDEWSEDKFTKEESKESYGENGVPLWQRHEIKCHEGGKMSSCEESCEVRLYYNGQWGEWTDC